MASNFHRSGLSFLKSGITLASLHKSGKIPVLKERFILSVSVVI